MSHDNIAYHSHISGCHKVMSHDKCGKVVYRPYSSCYRGTVNVLSGHPRWMFRKNSMEFFVGLQPYLYYYYSGCTLESHGHVFLPECSYGHLTLSRDLAY